MKQRYHRFGILTCLLLFLLTGNIVAQTNEENQQTYTKLMKQKNYGDAIRLMDKVLKDKESKTAENYYKRAAAYAAIDTDHQHYTFSEMLTDLDSIAKRYPDFVSYELDSATTLLGHRLPVDTRQPFGSSPHHGTSHHARSRIYGNTTHHGTPRTLCPDVLSRHL